VVYTLSALGLLLLCTNVLLLWNIHAPLLQRTKVHNMESNIKRSHPIDTLMKGAETNFQALISGQTTDLQSAAEAYRERRGHHPPPAFNEWVKYARTNNAVIAEELFDQIYRDLDPFWAVSARSMRSFARHFQDRIILRNRSASMTDNNYQGTAKDRMEAWLDAVKSLEHLLPNMDLAMNVMDESRVIVPWEEIAKHMDIEGQTKKLLPSHQILSHYSSLNVSEEEQRELPRLDWIGPGGEPYWDIARIGCAPRLPARYKATATNFTGPPPLPPGYPPRSYHGFVKNWTYVRDPCQQPHLQESHGTFIEPVSISTTHSLVPIFSESKLSVNNDILIPPAAYLSSSFAGGGYSHADTKSGNWSDKISGVVWRGVASGGRNREENWTRFHRHRFVSMLNGSYIQSVETRAHSVGQGQTFNLQSYATYRLTATKYMDLGSWLNRITNIGFTDLLCFPATENGKPTCNYTDPYFRTLTETLSRAGISLFCVLAQSPSKRPFTQNGMTIGWCRGCILYP
jgi:hypothetical protein